MENRDNTAFPMGAEWTAKGMSKFEYTFVHILAGMMANQNVIQDPAITADAVQQAYWATELLFERLKNSGVSNKKDETEGDSLW